MTIFKNYTGNAMLNNALMTIEALADLESVEAITPQILLNLYEAKDIKSLNKRLKSYTMLFSLNNPLVNPAKKQDNAGEKTYHNLLTNILKSFESEGEHICEVSGLRFQTTFEDFYKQEIEKQKATVRQKKLGIKDEKKLLNNLDNTDFSLNRSWFPLIGGLGSDAQALPQAKFTINIHPICIVIMQFLPLAALLYKGGILLIDSSNFTFSRLFIDTNVKYLQEKIQLLKSTEAIENVRDFTKSNYLLIALKILEEKSLEEEYCDLNLWSFSNSGTGASCSIDRVPNNLIQKLIKLKRLVRNELETILNKQESSFSFLQDLEANKEWWLLYPAVFGSGKKAIAYEGVSVKFLEAYFSVIQSSQNIEYAKYIAYLIDKYKSKAFEKYLSKTDAYNEKDYRVDIYVVLSQAAQKGEWSLEHHIDILDDNNVVPIKSSFRNIFKIVHFYYQKKVFSNIIPQTKNPDSAAKIICSWLISLIQHDDKKNKIIFDFTSKHEAVGYNDLFVRYANDFKNTNEFYCESILYALYEYTDMNLFKLSKYGINELLHIFFLQPIQKHHTLQPVNFHDNSWLEDLPTQQWLNTAKDFATDYQTYYFDKYENKLTGNKPISKFKNQVMNIPNDNTKFTQWLQEAIDNVNNFLKETTIITKDKWNDSLLYDISGEYSPIFSRLFLKILFIRNAFSDIK